MIYEKEVKDLLGPDVYETFLKAVDRGEVSEQQMSDIAYELHDRVGGDFKRAQSCKGFKSDRTAARKVLTNWYNHDPDGVATEKLVSVFQNENIALKPLAHSIAKGQTVVRDATSSVTIFQEFIKVAVDSNFKQIVSLKDKNTQLHSDIENLEMENLVLQGKMSDMAEVRRRKETRNCSLLTRLWKVTDTLRRKNNTLETENELLYESDEVDQVDIDLGRLVKKISLVTLIQC